jgi:hypothetical protein
MNTQGQDDQLRIGSRLGVGGMPPSFLIDIASWSLRLLKWRLSLLMLCVVPRGEQPFPIDFGQATQ